VEIDDAHRGRLIDVPLDPGAFGAFECLHRFANHAEFSIALRRLARLHHGTAAREFLRRFASELGLDKRGIVSWLQARRTWYLERARIEILSPNRDLERIHQKFATIYAASALAIRFEILRWSSRELSDALFACEQAHVDHVAQFIPRDHTVVSARPRAVVDPIECLRAHYQQNYPKFVDLRDGLLDRRSGHDPDECPGYFNLGPDGSVEILFTHSQLLQLCRGTIQVRCLKRQLEDRGWLIRDTNRPATRRSIWKGKDEKRVQVTAVREEALKD